MNGTVCTRVLLPQSPTTIGTLTARNSRPKTTGFRPVCEGKDAIRLPGERSTAHLLKAAGRPFDGQVASLAVQVDISLLVKLRAQANMAQGIPAVSDSQILFGDTVRLAALGRTPFATVTIGDQKQ